MTDTATLILRSWNALASEADALLVRLRKRADAVARLSDRVEPGLPLLHASVVFAMLEDLGGLEVDTFFERLGRRRRSGPESYTTLPAGTTSLRGGPARSSREVYVSERVTVGGFRELDPGYLPDAEPGHAAHGSWFEANLYAAFRDAVLPTRFELVLARSRGVVTSEILPEWCGDGPIETVPSHVDPFGDTRGYERAIDWKRDVFGLHGSARRRKTRPIGFRLVTAPRGTPAHAAQAPRPRLARA
jgi:hypothetical protein